ncbi:hypothetical protein BKA69DRAFT_1122429 [Paraphysoderma sedebokerense]|nr:hypothetical protein BKA69DRAFT_1122429 [Paraphysoderma sedebokerense]
MSNTNLKTPSKVRTPSAKLADKQKSKSSKSSLKDSAKSKRDRRKSLTGDDDRDARDGESTSLAWFVLNEDQLDELEGEDNSASLQFYQHYRLFCYVYNNDQEKEEPKDLVALPSSTTPDSQSIKPQESSVPTTISKSESENQNFAPENSTANVGVMTTADNTTIPLPSTTDAAPLNPIFSGMYHLFFQIPLALPPISPKFWITFKSRF